MNQNNYFTLLLTFLTTLIFSNILRVSLNNLSWAKLRKIKSEDEVKKIAYSRWLSNRDNYHLVLDYISVFSLIIITTIIASTIKADLEKYHLVVELTIIAIGAYLYTFGQRLASAKSQFEESWHLLRICMPVIHLLHIISKPFAWPLHKIFSIIINSDYENEPTIEDEILSLVEQDENESQTLGNSDLKADDRKMIQNIFELDDTVAKEIMTPRVDIIAIEESATIEEVKKAIIESGHSRLPVFKESIDEIIGAVYAKDLLNEKFLSEVHIGKLIHTLPYITEYKNVKELLRELRLSKKHMAIIIDEFGGTSGIVTIEDVLEEIVGEIQDEYDIDRESGEHEINSDGSIILDGRYDFSDFQDLIKRELTCDDDVETIAGYIIDHLGHIPSDGESFSIEDINFTIISADDRRILSVKINFLEEN